MTKRSYFYFVSAILGHLLLLSMLTTSFSFVFPFRPVEPPEADEQKGTVVPAYIMPREKLRPAEPAAQAAAQEEASPPASAPLERGQQSAKDGILKPIPQSAKQQVTPDAAPQKSSKAHAAGGAAVPNLISMKKIDKSLLKLLSQATSEKLFYPKSAHDFNVKGKVLIQFLLFPSGLVSDVALVGSSGSGVLDQAALDTINAISPVRGVDAYLHEPQDIEVGIIYE